MSDSKKKFLIKKKSNEIIANSQIPSKICRNTQNYGVGLDIHKDSIVCCVSVPTPNRAAVVLKQHTFKNDHRGVVELCHFLRKYANCTTILMECTGVYHIPVYHALKREFKTDSVEIIAMNPLLVHNRISDLGSKHDKADAFSMSSLAFYTTLLRPSYIGSVHFFTLRDLIRSYHKTLTQIGRIRNRIHRHLHAINQKFPFDLGAEWGIQLLDVYLSRDWNLFEAFEHLLNKMKAMNKAKVLEKRKDILHRHGEVTVTQDQRFTLNLELLRFLSTQEVASIYLKRAEELILANLGMKTHYSELLLIPGIGTVSALTIIAEIGDYTRFVNTDAFLKFCGVVPTIQQSGTMKSKGHINRYSNKHIRYVLFQAAMVLIVKKNRDSDLGDYAFKQRVIRQLPTKKAAMKVANKLGRTVFRVLTCREKYDPRFEYIQKKQAKIKLKLRKKGSLLESTRTRALRRDIQSFLVSNYEYLNSSSRHYLTLGFKRVLKKANFKGKGEDDNNKGTLNKK
jgi:transposase